MPVSNGLYYFLNPGGKPTTPPLVLIHGAGGSHLSWSPDIRRMSGYRVLTLDLPGHGKSTGVGKQTAEEYARALITFLDDVAIWKAVLIGHALGGAVALQLALLAPERVAGLCLLSCGMRLPIAEAILENVTNPATYPQVLQALLNGAFPGEDTPGRNQSARMLETTRPAVLHGDLLASNRFDVTTSLDGLRLPALVICGTDDRVVPLNLARSLSNAITNAAFQTIDGAGHALIWEQPRRVIALIDIFVKTIPYTPGL